MDIDVIDLFGLDFGIPQGILHDQCGPVPFRMGSCQVMSICRQASSNDFSIYFCTSFPGVLKLFKNQTTTPLSNDKTIPGYVEGPGCTFEILIVGGESLHGIKTSNSSLYY